MKKIASEVLCNGLGYNFLIKLLFFYLLSCQEKKYPSDLPSTSIVIVLHNEANSTLLRGLSSIVNRSPPKLLKEIIIIDDASLNRSYLHGPLDEFVKKLPVKVKVFHNKERLGLIRSRLRGADWATGDTLTFLGEFIRNIFMLISKRNIFFVNLKKRRPYRGN